MLAGLRPLHGERHRAADDLFVELEAGAARHRLDVEHDVAELAVAAGLLLVAAALGFIATREGAAWVLPEWVRMAAKERARWDGQAELVKLLEGVQ